LENKKKEMKTKTIPFLKTRVLESKRLLQKALVGVNRYAESLLQYESQQQQQQQQLQQQRHGKISKFLRPQYSQQGGGVAGLHAQQDAKAIEKINRLAARLTIILDEMMILLKSKDTEAIYTKAGAILYYLDFILDPYLTSKPVVELNTWSRVPIKMLTTNPLHDTMTASSLSIMSGLVEAQKKKLGPSTKKPLSLLTAQEGKQILQGKQQVKASAGGGGGGGMFWGLDIGDILPGGSRKRARQH